MVPPGALIKFVQKGLQYMEMEANLSNVSILFQLFFFFHMVFGVVRLSYYVLFVRRVKWTLMRISHSFNPWI